MLSKPRWLIDVLHTIEEQVNGVYYKSKVVKDIDSKVAQNENIATVLNNMNFLVEKYYVEELKPHEDSFKFRYTHLSMPKLWPAFSRQLVLFLNVHDRKFKNKINELLSYEHLNEIGYNVYVDKHSHSYVDKDWK